MSEDKHVLDLLDELPEDSAEEMTQDNLEEADEDRQPDEGEGGSQGTEEEGDTAEEEGAEENDTAADDVMAQLELLKSEKSRLEEEKRSLQSLHDSHYNQMQAELKELKEAVAKRETQIDNQPDVSELDFSELDPEVALIQLQKSLPSLVEKRAQEVLQKRFPEMVASYQQQAADRVAQEEDALALMWQEDITDVKEEEGLSPEATEAFYKYMRENFDAAREKRDRKFIAKAVRHARKATATATHQTTKADKKKIAGAVATKKQKKSGSEPNYNDMSHEELLDEL